MAPQSTFAAGDEAKEQVRSRINIVSLVERHVKLKASGRNFKGLCPFHKEKTPSFIVSPDRGTFHCFGCNKGGDVFTFVQEIEGVDFRQALEMLAEEAGVKLPTMVRSAEAPQPNMPSKPEMIRIHALAAKFFYGQVKGNERVVAYFRERGLRAETVREFQLGYAPDTWRALLEHLTGQGVSAEALVACGLAVEKSGGQPYDRFRDRLMFPLFDPSGRIVAFAGRGLGPDVEPKYLNSPETPIYRKSRLLYGVHKALPYIKEENRVIVVEGYMDYLALYEHGVRNVVATSGTALTLDHAQMLRRYSSRVTLVFDGDAAGVTAAERGVMTLAPAALEVRVLILPGELDPDEYVRKSGADAFRALVEGAVEGFQFLLDRAVAARGTDTPQSKSAVVGDMAGLLGQVSDSVVRAEYIRRLAERLRVAERVVSERVRASAPRPAAGSGALAPPGGEFGARLEGYFIKLLITHPELVQKAGEWVSPAVLTDAFSSEVYSVVQKAHARDPSLRTLLDDAVSAEQKRAIAELAAAPVVVQNPEEELKHVAVELQKKYVRSRVRETKEALRRNPGDAALLAQQRDLLGELGRLTTGQG